MANETRTDDELVRIEDLDTIPAALGAFRKAIEKINKLSEEITADTENIEAAWEGAGSEAVLAPIKAFKNEFASVNEQNNKFINYLGEAMEKYSTNENEDLAAVNTNLTDYKTYYKDDENNNN